MTAVEIKLSNEALKAVIAHVKARRKKFKLKRVTCCDYERIYNARCIRWQVREWMRPPAVNAI